MKGRTRKAPAEGAVIDIEVEKMPEKNGEKFAHGEAALARETGLAEREVAKGRLEKLRRGKDWDYVGQAVQYTKKGLRRLLSAIGLADAVDLGELARCTETRLLEAPQARPAETAGPTVAAGIVTGTVRRFFMNPHLIEVAFPDGTSGRVRVRDREKFKAGMALPLRREGDVFVLARKEPRWRGRW